MKKIFTILLLSMMIFAVGCGNNEQNTDKENQHKVEQTSKDSISVSIDEINKFASVCVDSFITLSNRITDIENSGKYGDMSKTEVDKFVNKSRKELDDLSNHVANSIQELKEKSKSGNVKKSEMDKFITETRNEIDSLSLKIAKVEREIE